MATSLDRSTAELSALPSGENSTAGNPAASAEHTGEFSVAAAPGDQTAQFSAAAPAGSMDLTPPADGQNATLDGVGRTQHLAAPLPAQGETFGDYELVREIARGGMGVVYQARQRSLDRTVALKMILDGQLANDTAVQRFYKEAQAAAGLDHPNIVPIYEIGQEGNRHFFTMAYIEGASLKAVIKNKPSVLEALEYTIAVADAVAYAHSKNIIHRDLKPDNVLIDTQNRPRVTDFGLAKRIQGDVNLTGAGQILGTPSYMAPEQALGGNRQIGPGADVYAVGGILYFLLTGKPPIQGDSLGEVLCRVISEAPVKPQELNLEIPDEVQTLILKCLEKDPAKRYASAAELGLALKDLARSASAFGFDSTQPFSRIQPAPTPTRGRWPLFAGLAAVFLIGIGLSLVSDPFGWFAEPSKIDDGQQANVSPLPNPNPGKDGIKNPGKEPLVKGGDPGNTKKSLPIKDNGEKIEPIVFDPDLLKPFDEKKSVLLQIPEPKHKEFGLIVRILGGAPKKNDVVQLKPDEKFGIEIKTEIDAWVGIWSFEADGSVVQILPNENQDGFVRRDKVYLVPDQQSQDSLAAGAPAGIEFLRVMASTEPFPKSAGVRGKDELFTAFKTVEQRREFVGNLRGLVGKTAAKQDIKLSEQVLKYEVKAAN